MVLHPAYTGKNVGLDDLHQSLLIQLLCDMKSSEIQLEVKEHFSDVFNWSVQEISLEVSFKNVSVV